MKPLAGAVVALAALAVPSSAAAVPPAITGITVQERHLVMTFSAPRADFSTVYVARSPERATDGAFLTENIETLDVLTDSEIQAGRWLHESQLDPGTYYVMMRASPDFDACYIIGTGGFDPACADGYSQVVQVSVPKPTIRYSGRVLVYRFLRQASATLTANPMGEVQPYQVCYRTRARARRCLSGRLRGFSWNSPATSTLTIGTAALATYTTFQWYVGGRIVATRRVRTR